MSENHLPHDHSGGAMLRLQESVETIGGFQTVADIFKLLSDSSRVRIFWLLCHCEECVVDLSATVGMSPPAVSHHLRQLRESGLVVSRRVGKEVCYRAAESEQAQLLHRMIERTMEISCPEAESRAATGAPHLPPLDAEVHEGGGTSEQIATIRAVHDYLTHEPCKPHHDRRALAPLSHEPIDDEGALQVRLWQLARLAHPRAPHGARGAATH